MRAQRWRAAWPGVLLFAVLASSIAIGSLATAQSEKSEKSEKKPGYLGVTSQTLTEELREGLGFKYTGDGVLVNGVADGSPADEAGIQKGDVITSVGGRSVTSSSRLREIVRGLDEGENVTVNVVRESGTRTFTVRLDGADEAERDMETFEFPVPPDAPMAPRARAFRWDGHGMHEFDGDGMGTLIRTMGRGRLGVRVENLDEDLAGYFKVPGGKGALVMGVVEDSPAEKAGIKKGDVITRVNDKAIEDTEDLTRALRDVEEGDVRLTLVRHGATQTVKAGLPQRDVVRMRTTEPGMRSRTYRFDSGDAELKRQMDELKREVAKLREELDKKSD